MTGDLVCVVLAFIVWGIVAALRYVWLIVGEVRRQ